MQIETFSHAESTDVAQEKQARSYELALAKNKRFVNSKCGADVFNPRALFATTRPPLGDVTLNQSLAYGIKTSRNYRSNNPTVRRENLIQNIKSDFRSSKSRSNVQEVPEKGSPNSWESCSIKNKQSSSETLFPIGIASKWSDNLAKVPSTLSTFV